MTTLTQSRGTAAAAFGLGLLLLAAAPLAAVRLPSGFTATQVAKGLQSPTAMALTPDGRLLVCEQSGKLKVIKNGALLAAPMLALTVDHKVERGLLGVAVDPDFPQRPYIYLYYTVPPPAPHNRISRFTVAGDHADPGSERILVELPRLGSAMHNGGAMHFGPDGMLYVATGENARAENAQRLDTPLGKILRFAPDGSIPDDNPFFAQASGLGRASWAMGLRNPFTFAFQRGSGRMLINDVGGKFWEEINEGVAGANYGWPRVEGPSNDPAFRSPLFAYRHGRTAGEPPAPGEVIGCAITGGVFYDPPVQQLPASYRGNYFFGDFCTGFIYRLEPANGNRVTRFARKVAAPVDFEVAADGSFYFLAYLEGAVYRVTYSSSQAPEIAAQPEDQRVAPGSPASFAVIATGKPPLSYQWRRGGTPIPGATSASYTLPSPVASDDGSRFSVVVSNALGSVSSRGALLTVVAGSPPTVAITAPAAGVTYAAGETVEYAGSAVDAEDGSLPAAALTWKVDFHHDTHFHPFLPATSGQEGGSFVVPADGETAANVWFRIHLAARDSDGLTGSTFVDVLPRTAVLTLASDPPGLQLTLDGAPVTTPFVETGVVGMRREVGAHSPQLLGGTLYELDAWSDGGEPVHEVATPAADTTLTARFRPLPGPAQGLLATYFGSPGLSGPALVRLDAKVNFNWGDGSPAPGIVPADGFSARWTGTLEAPATGSYTILVRSDEGARLWLDDQLLIDDWGPHGSQVASASVELVAGEPRELRLEYRELGGEAGIRLLWAPPGQPRDVIPASALRPGS